jgi:hypothetical protein
VKLVVGYLSRDPSKNWTADEVKNYLAAGIGCEFNWEDGASAALLGAAQGQRDAIEACRQLKLILAGVGFGPPTQLGIVFSVDQDINVGDPKVMGEIASYFREARAVCHQNGFWCGAYGEADLIDFLHNAGLTDFGWETLAWSGGRLSPNADLYQSSINNTVANSSVDLDTIIHPDRIGAWWPAGEVPAGSGVPIQLPSTTPVRDGMYDIIRNGGAVVACGLNYWRHLEGKTPEETARNIAYALSGPLCGTSKVTDVSPAGMGWWKAFYLGTSS